MDRDTPNFGLDFGPNTLSIRGALVRVRLHNVTAKRLVMDIVHGGITAVDLGNRLGRVSSASIATVDADIAITTLRPTTARVRQNSADLTCISAPPGSLYRDTPCQRVCGFVKPPPPPPPPPPGAVVTEDDFEPCLGKVGGGAAGQALEARGGRRRAAVMAKGWAGRVEGWAIALPVPAGSVPGK
jgi:hypothetical protein